MKLVKVLGFRALHIAGPQIPGLVSENQLICNTDL
jgi:hypothetical protein